MIYIFGIFKEFIPLFLLSPFDDIQSYYQKAHVIIRIKKPAFLAHLYAKGLNSWSSSCLYSPQAGRSLQP